jgi:hypothetical protein
MGVLAGLTSELLAPVIQTGTELLGKILDYHLRYRDQMDPEVRKQWDEIGVQIYWDWRDGWQALGVVGQPVVKKPGA